jgi:tetratricopeptide (TPR) repeat protein
MQTNEQKAALVEAKSTIKQPRTQMEALRDTLSTIEMRIAKLKEISTEDTLEILTLLDQAQEKFNTLEAAGGSASSEGTLYESLLRQLDKKSATFLNQVGGPAALQRARQERQPDLGYWWWYIDEDLAQKRRSRFKSWATSAAIGGALLIVLIVLYNQFLAPDPVTRAGIGFQQAAENKFIQGQHEEALADVHQAIEHLPDYPELYVLQGVIYEILEQPDLAEESYQLAREGLSKEDAFYNERAKYFLMANLAERAIADAELASSINPDSAISYLYIGQAYEVIGDYSAATEYYEAASEAAERTNDVEVQVIARMNLAQVLQRIAPPATPVPTE